jgi:glycosyltransferase involved in cell wall biosynthesis
MYPIKRVHEKVCMFVWNDCTHDARVLKEASTLTKVGYQVTIFAGLNLNTKPHEERDGFIIKRFFRPHIFLLYSGQIDLLKISISFVFFHGRRFFKSIKLLETKKTDLNPVPKIGLLVLIKKWAKAMGFNKKSVEIIGTSVFYSSATVNAAIKEKAQIYHAHDLNTLQMAYTAARRVGARLIYDSHELYTEMGARSRIEKQKWTKLEKGLIGKADKVITINQSIAGELVQRYAIAYPEVIMNCPPKTSLNIPAKSGDNLYRTRFNLSPDIKIILYSGGFSSNRGLDLLVQSAFYLKDKRVIIFMGEGKIENQLRALTDENKLNKKVLFMPSVPQKEVVLYTQSADIGVIPYQKVGLNNYYSTPNKLFDFIMAGIPVAASNFPELKRIIEGNYIGKVFNEKDPKDMARIINEILDDALGYQQMKANAKKTAEVYSWENEEKKLIRIYNDLTKNIITN